MPATQYVFVGDQITEQKNKQMDKGNSPQLQIIYFEWSVLLALLGGELNYAKSLLKKFF